ncbi:hypothetical protein ACFSX9_08780 [Flavobacterium ardleyense]|uniref:Outer membrane protein beta-barrel domain-containing protein n=1 Tax=Flavobacterium ardleyense TaxID=2038737 RepID=A0ABW5Z8I2_9FLAO
MKYIISILTLLFTFAGFSQETIQPSPFGDFTQFEISVPLQGNKNRGEVYPDGSTNDSWFLPDGVNVNFGYGYHYKQWIGLSANTGIGMKLSEKLIMTPVFANLRIMPKIGEETRLGIDLGFGQTFALGRGDLSGTFKRVKLNLEADELQLFVELVSYGIDLHNNSQGSISLGIALVTF